MERKILEIHHNISITYHNSISNHYFLLLFGQCCNVYYIMEFPRVLTRNNFIRKMNFKFFLPGYYRTNERQSHISYCLPYNLKCVYKKVLGKLLFSKIVDISWKAPTSFLLSTQKCNVLYKAWFFESYISSARNNTVCSERTHFTLEA